MQAVPVSRVAFLGGNKSIPVKHKHILLPPTCSSPIKTEQATTWEWTAPDNTVCMVQQYVRYQRLPPPSVLRSATTTSQARLHGVLGQRSMYETFLVYPPNRCCAGKSPPNRTGPRFEPGICLTAGRRVNNFAIGQPWKTASFCDPQLLILRYGQLDFQIYTSVGLRLKNLSSKQCTVCVYEYFM